MQMSLWDRREIKRLFTLVDKRSAERDSTTVQVDEEEKGEGNPTLSSDAGHCRSSEASGRHTIS